VPVPAPIERVVAAPAKLTVVAVAFTKLNVVWFVISMIFFSLAIFINKSV